MREGSFEMVILLVSAVLTVAIMSSAPHVSAADPVELIERTAAALILEHADYTFPVEQACGDGTTTVGGFIAESLLLASDDTGAGLNVAINCEAHANTAELGAFYSSILFAETTVQQLQQMPPGSTLHQCTLTLGASNGEARWAKGVQVLIDETAPRIIEGTARCISTP